jgi:DNA-binding transcriptional LysR family regulator
VELRQLRYFVTLAEELHFGRAAAREHIVQSALSQQLQRLEREFGVPLLERDTHHVRLTASGAALLAEARTVLRAAERAVLVARAANPDACALRVAVGDASLDTVPQVLRAVRRNAPELVVHRIEAQVPEQVLLLSRGDLDVGIGRAWQLPDGITAELLRVDPLGLLVDAAHPLAALPAVPVALLEGERLLLGEDSRAPEFNDFVLQRCAAAGVRVTRYPDSVQSIRAAAYLVAEQHCVCLVPRSADVGLPGVRWLPLEPAWRYPWSLLYRTAEVSPGVRALRSAARAVGSEFGWLASDAALAGYREP